MSDETIAWLTKAITHGASSVVFCCHGTLPNVDPELQVEGMRQMCFPLGPTSVKKLKAKCTAAPYGKGTKTLFDANVRKCLELDASQFTTGDKWNEEIHRITNECAEEFGLPGDQLTAEPYKLLLYESGGFFLPHRDSEKRPGMVASLIVVLPHRFSGGELITSHRGRKERFEFEAAAARKHAEFAAFYADCEHEVRTVTSGLRICLAYNLVLGHGAKQKPKLTKANSPEEKLTNAIKNWFATRPESPLVFALEHHYTQDGLAINLLKGADRKLVALIFPAVKRAEGCFYLGQVSRHLCQDAFHSDGGSRGRWDYDDDDDYDDDYDSGDLEIGDTIEEELYVDGWADADGETQEWGAIGVSLSSIVSTIPINDWTPTTEEYEGYTGNAGNTLDRWYHRSAIVVWHRDNHFDVITSGGVQNCLPDFLSFIADLANAPQDDYEFLRQTCIRFAKAIIANWEGSRHWEEENAISKSSTKEFLDALLLLDDPALVSAFLIRSAKLRDSRRLDHFITTACDIFGWYAFAKELKGLLSDKDDERYSSESFARNVEWLCAFCLHRSKDPERLDLAEDLCTIAVARFRKIVASMPNYSRSHRHDDDRERTASPLENLLPSLLKAAVAGGSKHALSEVINVVMSYPTHFSIEHALVPSFKKVIPWSRKARKAPVAELETWLEKTRSRLENAIATPPKKPADWARPAELNCQCKYCIQLAPFLADPATEVGKIAAPEHDRSHISYIIDHNQCDVSQKLEKKGSPYSLILTKTNGSYHRATKRYELDSRLLRELPAKC